VLICVVVVQNPVSGRSSGIYVTTLPTPENILPGIVTTIVPGKKAKLVLASANARDLVYLKELIEAGKLRTVIDRTYSLQDLAAAHTYSESERAVGKIAIAVI